MRGAGGNTDNPSLYLFMPDWQADSSSIEGQLEISMARIRSNRICFTLNNFTSEEQEEIVAFCERGLDKENVEPGGAALVYACIGEEAGGKAETVHLQGFIRLVGSHVDAARRGARFWKSVPGLARAHLENARGSDGDNQRYCSKEGFYQEWGSPGEAEESVYSAIVGGLQGGDSVGEVCIRHPEEAVKHFGNIRGLGRILAKSVSIHAPETLREWQVYFYNGLT